MYKYAFLDSTANQLNLDPFDRSKIIAAAVALVAVYKAPIPSTAVGSAQTLYRRNISLAVGELLSEFGEGSVLDYKFAKELAEAMWLVRYNAVHNPAFPFGCTEEGFFDQALGVSRFVSKEAHCFLNKYKECIFKLALPLYSCVNAIDASLTEDESSIVRIEPEPAGINEAVVSVSE